jgi:asparagine synthase (glutamine-hydrolysing)
LPGISLKCNLNSRNTNHDNTSDEIFLKASESVIHNSYYKREILLNQYPYSVICTRYLEYPIKILDNSGFWVCVEGKIYGKDQTTLENEINDLIEHIFNTETWIERDKQVIADWLFKTDGDFVIYALNKKTKDFFILNDLLGRLPLYYYIKDKSAIIVSREIQMMSSLIQSSGENTNKFDMMGIAQLLLFRHTLGKRTLLNNIYRMEPASLLRIYNSESKIELDNLYVFNFEKEKYSDESIKENVHTLVSLFSEACKNRVDYDAKNIISLSGGFDSRTIAASLHKNKIPHYAVTSTEPNWRPVVGNTSETEIAELLAKSLNIEWEDYGIMEPEAEHIVLLLRIKNGLTYLAHSFLPRFLQELKQKHASSRINFFTGHGGDVLFSDMSYNIKDLDSLIRVIFRNLGFFSLGEIAALTKIKESEIVNEIRNLLDSYPEENMGPKYVHYLLFEYNYKFSFEIEDINRSFFWTVSPFYSIPFFKYIIDCSDHNKSDYTLYREFLLAISPSAAAINNSNWGCSILSSRFKMQQYILSLLNKHRKLRTLRKVVKKINNRKSLRYRHDSRIIRCIREQVDSCNAVSKYLSYEEIERILNNCDHYDHVAIDDLFTITSILENNLCESYTIKKYY